MQLYRATLETCRSLVGESFTVQRFEVLDHYTGEWQLLPGTRDSVLPNTLAPSLGLKARALITEGSKLTSYWTTEEPPY